MNLYSILLIHKFQSFHLTLTLTEMWLVCHLCVFIYFFINSLEALMIGECKKLCNIVVRNDIYLIEGSRDAGA